MSNVQSAVPVHRPEPGSVPEHESRFRQWFYTDKMEGSETITTLGHALNTFSRTILKSEKLPGIQLVQSVCERLCWDHLQEAKDHLASGVDCDPWPFMHALGATFSRYASEQLSPRFVKGGPEWKTNALGFTAAVGDLLNARIAVEKARRVEKAKDVKESPADLAKLCSKGLPQVAALEAFVSELAGAIRRQEGSGGFGGSASIRENYGEPLAKLRRFLEAQITHYEKVERDRAAAQVDDTLPDNTPPHLRADALAMKRAKKGVRSNVPQI